MNKLSLDISYLEGFFSDRDYEFIEKETVICHDLLMSRKGAGHQYLGWLEWPESYDREEVEKIIQLASHVRNQSEVVIIIGIGGSYLGARAAIEALGHSFANKTSALEGNPEIYFAGINLSSRYISHLLDIIKNRDFSLIVISKSGTTLEPAIAFRILREELRRRFGPSGIKDRIVAITDRQKGALKTLASEQGYKTFAVPDDVGGRYSVLTPVGLLPIAIAGIDIQSLLAGAAAAVADLKKPFEENICMQYAAMRNLLYRKGFKIEILIAYEPCLISFSEWWKQLFGESEGKEGKGIFPSSASFTMDLHSLGQYIQQGHRHLFETVLKIDKDSHSTIIPKDEKNLDGLNYLAGKQLHFINHKASEGTLQAHVEGGIPNLVFKVPELNSYHLGYLFYFFEKSCAISGYLLRINPFDQPGVEAYKKNMFRLLGKPGI